MKYVFWLILASFMAIHCSHRLTRFEREKIRFDHTSIDTAGLRHSEAAVDYEFCIPTSDPKLSEVKAIEPDVRVLKNSKGRIGCSDAEWLCIVNTHDAEWRKKLFTIASLPFVERIEETFYE